MSRIWCTILLLSLGILSSAQEGGSSVPPPTPWNTSLDWPRLEADTPSSPPPDPAVDFAPTCDLSPNSCPACDKWWRFESAAGNVYSMHCESVIVTGQMYLQTDHTSPDGIFSIGDCLAVCDLVAGCSSASFVGDNTCYISVGSDVSVAPYQSGLGFLRESNASTTTMVSVATTPSIASQAESGTSIEISVTASASAVNTSPPGFANWQCGAEFTCADCQSSFRDECNVGPLCFPDRQNITYDVESFDCIRQCDSDPYCLAARYNINNNTCTICEGKYQYATTFDGELGIFVVFETWTPSGDGGPSSTLQSAKPLSTTFAVDPTEPTPWIMTTSYTSSQGPTLPTVTPSNAVGSALPLYDGTVACPALNGTEWELAGGQPGFEILCDVSPSISPWYVIDFTDSLQQCVEMCEERGGSCQALTWSPDNQECRFYRFRASTPTRSAPGTTMAVLLSTVSTAPETK